MKDKVNEQTDTEADGMRVHLVNFFQTLPEKYMHYILFWPFELYSEDGTEIKVLHDWILHPKKNGENVWEKEKDEYLILNVLFISLLVFL